MAVTLLFVFLTVAGLATGRNFNLQNNLGHTVWVGIQGTPDKGQPENGGFVLNSRDTRTVNFPDDWAGSIWARTGCTFDENGHGYCNTGDCANKLQCNGAGGIPPVTLADIKLSGAGGKDFYDVSLVDGFNVPVQMTPTVGGGNGYYCTTAGCTVDLNPECPDDLKVRNGVNVVACNSSCLAYNTDEFCCRGRFNNQDYCKSSSSALYFKTKCPGTYCYAYDDGTNIFNCVNTDYNIIFG